MNINDLGAIGDGIFDNSTIINNALANYPAVYIPSGNYRCNSKVVIPTSRKLSGDGSSSVINYMGVGGEPVIELQHSPAGGEISRLQIISMNSMANEAILINLTTGKYVARHLIEYCHASGYNSKAAIRLTNPNQDGYFCSTIKDNMLTNGGIKLERLGDSMVIEHNTVTGLGDGIFTTFVSGAAQTVIKRNNITARGRSILLGDYAMNTSVEDNQIEHVAGSEPYAVLVAGQPTSRPMNNSIVNNNINGHGTISAAGILVYNANNTSIKRNVFNSLPWAVYVHSSSDGTYFGELNTYNGINNSTAGSTNTKTVQAS